MKLDRNINPTGRGKYALVNLRNVTDDSSIWKILLSLQQAGALTFGNEAPGEQFFVMKYKDKFTAPALRAYAKACQDESDSIREGCGRTNRAIGSTETANSLEQFADEIALEAQRAEALGCKHPD